MNRLIPTLRVRFIVFHGDVETENIKYISGLSSRASRKKRLRVNE